MNKNILYKDCFFKYAFNMILVLVPMNQLLDITR